MSSKGSEVTRKGILEATWKLLKEGPETRTRMADVAKEAGVSRQAVYLHFPSRAELLVATTRYIDEKEDIAGQMAAVFENENARMCLEAFVHVWGNYIPIIAGGARRLLAIRETDPDANAAWQDRMGGLYSVCEQIVEMLNAQNVLAKDLAATEAADLMWAALSVQQWEMLTVDRGISQERYLDLTHRGLRHTLLI